MINVGDILSTVGVFSTVERYHEYCGFILSAMRDTQYREGYHDARGEYHGVFGIMGGNLLLFEYPTVLNTHSTHDIPHMYHDIPKGTQITKDAIPRY